MTPRGYLWKTASYWNMIAFTDVFSDVPDHIRLVHLPEPLLIGCHFYAFLYLLNNLQVGRLNQSKIVFGQPEGGSEYTINPYGRVIFYRELFTNKIFMIFDKMF